MALSASLAAARQFLQQFLVDYRAAACQNNAAALTYMTLFALVPLMTVTYAAFSMVPEFDGMAAKLQKFLFAQFVPESSAVLQSYFASFSKQAQKLTVFGALFLAVTAFLMLGNIERCFNKIWGVDNNRRGLAKVLLYWAVLSIGPLLLGAAFALSTYLFSLKFVVQTYQSLGIEQQIIAWFPAVLNTLAFSFLLIAVPNCRVPRLWGFLGGLLTALGFELLKTLFAKVVASTNFKFIYGAFAALPLFLLWVNLVWMMVLGGAVWVRLMAERRYAQDRPSQSDLTAALCCLGAALEAQSRGEGVDEDTLRAWGLEQQRWPKLRQRLLEQRWLALGADGQLLLCRDLRQLSLWDLLEMLDLRLSALVPPAQSEATSAVFTCLQQGQAQFKAQCDTPLLALLPKPPSSARP